MGELERQLNAQRAADDAAAREKSELIAKGRANIDEFIGIMNANRIPPRMVFAVAEAHERRKEGWRRNTEVKVTRKTYSFVGAGWPLGDTGEDYIGTYFVIPGLGFATVTRQRLPAAGAFKRGYGSDINEIVLPPGANQHTFGDNLIYTLPSYEKFDGPLSFGFKWWGHMGVRQLTETTRDLLNGTAERTFSNYGVDQIRTLVR